MGWYAVRTIYLCALNLNGVNVFEERVVSFESRSAEEAHAKAKAEADEYAHMLGYVVHAEQESYEQDGDIPIKDGYELWSALFESKESLEEFFANRYGKYRYSGER